MRRLFYRGILDREIEIEGADAHHLMHVMRARCGQTLVIVDAAGTPARMEITGFSADAVRLRLVERLAALAPIDIEECDLLAASLSQRGRDVEDLAATGLLVHAEALCLHGEFPGLPHEIGDALTGLQCAYRLVTEGGAVFDEGG